MKIKIIENHPNYTIDEYGNIFNIKRNKPIKWYLNPKGYYKVVLNHIHYPVHRLVALNYILNPNNLPQVNHIDGIKTNNHISNLEWVSCKDNIIHAVKNNLTNQSGVKNNNSKLSEKEVLEIKELLKTNITQKDIAKKYNVGKNAIFMIKHNITWKNTL